MTKNNEQLRVNVRTTVNREMIKRETRNGREVIVVHSATLPDDIVMNGIKYPADEIEKSYKTLEGTPAPLGHPTVNGEFVSAKSPLGIAIGYIGAHNENVRREDGRVLLDKVFDVKRAEESEGGRRVLEALNGDSPIHTSTGLMCYVSNNEAFDMEFDHDAILLDEEGAGKPEDGVGMMVNAQGDRVRVVNSTIDQEFEQEIDWAAQSIVRAIERRDEQEENKPAVDRIKSAILKALGLGRETETETNEDLEMTEVTKEQFEELSAKVNALAEVDTAKIVADAIAPLTKALNEQKEAAKNAADAEHSKMVEKVVEANKLTEETAKLLPLEALKELANATAGAAAPIAGGFEAKEADKSAFVNDWEEK